MYQITSYETHPPITMERQQLTEIVLLHLKGSNQQFDFGNFTSSIHNYLKTNNLGYNIPDNTTYTQGIHNIDKARIREIIWDQIIERHLTVGTYDHDSWPFFSITEKGKIFFNQ